MSRLCPDDGATLERRAFHGVILDVCPLCAGIYFDEGEMAALHGCGTGAIGEVEEAAVPSDLRLIEGERPRRCPACRALMCAYAYRYSSAIRLDGCEACGGVWVEDGELASIAAHLKEAPLAFGGIPAARRHALTLRAGLSGLAHAS